MNTIDLVAALDLPSGCRLDQRVPKKLLVENGAPTAADKRRITEGIEDIYWLAALKPAIIGVPEYRDEVREYLEVALLSVTLRPEAKVARLAELIHRAVPYPVLLLMVQGDALTLSLAHKRWSQGEADKTVLDGDLVCAELRGPLEISVVRSFREMMSLSHQPGANLHALYQGWIDTVLALQIASITGCFTISASPEQAEARRDALRQCVTLEAEIAALRTVAAKEKQIHRQVKINLEHKRLQAKFAVAREAL